MSDLLRQLAIEAELITPTEDDLVELTDGDARPIEEIMLDDAQSVQPTEIVQHAKDARAIADDLDALADRADKLADEDEDGIHGSIAVESLHREFNTIMKANKLGYKAFSFECAGNVPSQLTGISEDARRTALDLRNASANMLSQEAVLSENKSGFFTNKEDKIREAVITLRNQSARFDGVSKQLKESAVALSHNGLARFLTTNYQPVTNLREAFNTEAKYNAGVVKYIEERVAYLKKFKGDETEVRQGDRKLVNIVDDGNYVSDKDYILLGNETVVDFTNFGGLPGNQSKIPYFKIIVSGLLSSVDASGLSVEGVKSIISDALALAKINREGLIKSIFDAENHLNSLSWESKEVKKAALLEARLAKEAWTITEHRAWYVVSNSALLVTKVVDGIKI